MTTCKKCGKTSEKTAKVLLLCAECIREGNSKYLAELEEIHTQERKKFGLAGLPPRSSN